MEPQYLGCNSNGICSGYEVLSIWILLYLCSYYDSTLVCVILLNKNS